MKIEGSSTLVTGGGWGLNGEVIRLVGAIRMEPK